MKFITILLDGNGEIHALGSRSPDLLRRNVGRATGSAEILHCGMPVAGQSTEQVCIMLERRIRLAVGHKPTAIPASPATLKTVRYSVWRITVAEPALARIWASARRVATCVAQRLGVRTRPSRAA